MCGFVDGFACGLGGWKYVNFCVGDLVEVMWRMRTNDGRRENGCSDGRGIGLTTTRGIIEEEE